MDGHNSDIIVIGAGMAGLTCATRLSEAGHTVRVLDKGRGPGGRMAARRAEVSGEPVSFDHGAQYFTARNDGFQAAVDQWARADAVAKWPAAGNDAWVGLPNMNGPIRIMADPLGVRWSTRAESIARNDDGWSITTDKGDFTAKIVLVAVPAEQAAELLHDTAPGLADVANGVVSEPCWAVMAAFEEALDIPEDTVRGEDTAISWAARNSAKPGRFGKECWVIHASPSRSREIIDLPREEVGEVLLADFFDQTGAEQRKAIHVAAHRWLYAMPSAASGDPSRFDRDARIGIAGDYLHSPRVEGAWISGNALAEEVLKSR